MLATLFDQDPEDLVWSNFAALTVAPVPRDDAMHLIRDHHYARGGGSNCLLVGLWNGTTIVGVAAFGVPVSGDAASSVFGREHQHRIMDLQRLVLVDAAPSNTESWFIVRALRDLKARRPETWAVTTFADITQGHLGVIYQATNAIYGGLGGTGTAYMDAIGVLHSDRLDGKAVSVEVAQSNGWTRIKRSGKHRYVYLLPDNKLHRKDLRRLLCWQEQPYPKREQATQPLKDTL